MSLACWVPYEEINFYVPTGFVTYCCKHKFAYTPKIEDYSHGKDFLNNDYVNNIKTDLLNEKKIEMCSSCWKSEEAGEHSWRQTQGIIPEEYNNIESLTSTTAFYNQVALYFDNTCDMKCVYCSPGLSSKWEAEANLIKQGKVKVNYKIPKFKVYHDKSIYQVRIQRIHEFLEALGSRAGQGQDHVNLTILGGEPLLSPEIKDSNFLKYIDSFYKYADKDFSLIFTIHTNGNTPKKVLDRFLNDVKSAKQKYENFHLKIIISVDTVGKTSEYIRSGSNWDTINSNIHRYYKSEVVDQIGFSPTLSIFSIASLENIVDYWISLSKTYTQKINMSVGLVYNPWFMNPYNLTADFVKYIDLALEKINANTDCFTEISLKLLNDRLNNLTDKIKNNKVLDDELRKALGDFLDYTVTLRNQNVYDFIPELKDL